MVKESSSCDQGVPCLEYSPADRRFPLLFELSRPLDGLEKNLPVAFAGRTMRMIDVFHEHHIDTPYIKSHYKTALLNLEAKGMASACPPATRRRKATFADSVMVTFPRGATWADPEGNGGP